MWYNGIPQASPSEYHYTTLRVQYPYTLENHSTTITYMYTPAHVLKHLVPKVQLQIAVSA